MGDNGGGNVASNKKVGQHILFGSLKSMNGWRDWTGYLYTRYPFYLHHSILMRSFTILKVWVLLVSYNSDVALSKAHSNTVV